MAATQKTARRRGARRRSEVPEVVLAQLANGTAETVNLMEWLAADMAGLARCVAGSCRGALARAIGEAADKMEGRGITDRLRIAGRAIAGAAKPSTREFRVLASHCSDIVRQWACYAVNSDALDYELDQRLLATLPFAADRNMNVREAAWMAFRPHLQVRLHDGLRLLEPVTRADDQNLRRFAVEVTRPRSVWGSHIRELKHTPERALPLLENVRQDGARYVQLAVGNWLNDASKTRADWVRSVCERWMRCGDPHTATIVRRGLRTIERGLAAGQDWSGLPLHPLPSTYPGRDKC